jgi:electron transfer flavoprotein alpha subunit
MSGILVVAEHRQGVMRETTLECVGAAQKLAQAGGLEYEVALLSKEGRALSQPLMGKVAGLRYIEHAAHENYSPEPYLDELCALAAQDAPSFIIMGHTSQGMDLAPALAARLSAPVVTDCVSLALEGDALTCQRRVYGGKIVEDLGLKPASTVVITIQPGAFEQPEGGADTKETDHASCLEQPERLRRFVEYLAAAVEDVDIAAADILVSVGRGIGDEENIALAQELADAIGATLSCSRPVADAGWLPKSRQVGTSGKTVRPKLYIALGISGAFQHQAGMKGAETILAVNKDPKAPIFQVAHYGIVDDLFKVVPVLTERLKSL